MLQSNDRIAPGSGAENAVTAELRRAAWISAGALITIALTVLGLAALADRTEQWLHRSREVARLSRSVLALAVDAETGIRGYLVTHDPESLAPQVAADARIDATLDSLVAVTASDSTNHTAALEIREAIDQWRVRFARPALATGSAAAADRAAGDSLAGKESFDLVRTRAQRLISGVDSAYDRRLQNSRLIHWVATLAVCAEVLLVLGAMSWLSRQLVASANTLEKQRGELAGQAAELKVQAERAQAEMRQKARVVAVLDAALASSPVGFAFFDRDLRFLRVNPTLAAVNGRSPEDHVGATLGDIHPWLTRDVEPMLRRVLTTRTAVVNEEFLGPAPGAPRAIRSWLTSAFPIVTDDGDLYGVGVAVTDVTEHKRLEEQFLQAQKMEAVGRLAGGVAHDFNNLLTVISSYAELILFDPAMAKGRGEIEEIRGAAQRAAKLTRQLLAFSRRQAMEPRIVNPNDVLRGVEALMRGLIVGAIEIATNLSPDTPLIRVDPGQLEQVVMNLAINAADAMPEGGVLEIETAGEAFDDSITEHDAELAPGTYAVIRVRDSGHGMTDEIRAQIFEPFFTTKEPGRGTGLGLSTAFGIVKQSGGHIEVESRVGEGTVFTVYLPAVENIDTAV
jgi:PAS domain S-box-containing protein